MTSTLQHLIHTIQQIRDEPETRSEEDVIKVSDTVAVAASAYEVVRNTLEYDDEHLLRRNAIRRILKRRLGETDTNTVAEKLLRELIWAKYLPNKRIENTQTGVVGTILEKYKAMFTALEEDTRDGQEHYDWLLDVLSTEIEYQVAPPCVDESLASFAYQTLKERVRFETNHIREEDRDLQLYIAVHRAILKSNRATLRYRLLTLYYPAWRTAGAQDAVVQEVSSQLKKVVASVDGQIEHTSADAVYRFVRRHAIVFSLIADIAQDNPDAFALAVSSRNTAKIDSAITAAAKERYGVFRARLTRTVVRAAFFLLLTKSILAVLVEYPYEVFVLQTTDYLPLAVNILFPPLLLAVVGLSVRIPKQRNTQKILEETHAFLGTGDDMAFLFKQKRPWSTGPLSVLFNLFYIAVFVALVVFIGGFLRSFGFNSLSIFFFLFFLSLVAYFGLRIRNTRREYLVIDTAAGFFGLFGDMVFLPIVRAGRWIALRAPKVNIFLFFFDFIVEAPFKATIGVMESWVAFLREKREEI
ncbi:hypothetical protein FJZ23_01090 [Candidatus Parcubacteria bacterium]|nr:hypothetical protein [Candidatus Parcubacteria bacterium]